MENQGRVVSSTETRKCPGALWTTWLTYSSYFKAWQCGRRQNHNLSLPGKVLTNTCGGKMVRLWFQSDFFLGFFLSFNFQGCRKVKCWYKSDEPEVRQRGRLQFFKTGTIWREDDFFPPSVSERVSGDYFSWHSFARRRLSFYFQLRSCFVTNKHRPFFT